MFNLCRSIRGAPLRALSRRYYSPRPRYVRFSPPSKSPIPSGNGGPGKRSFFDDRTWPMKLGVGFAGVGLLYYIMCLEQVPETGRWRFMTIGPRIEAEIGKLMGNSIHEEFRPKILPPDHVLSLHVRRVVSGILAASNLGVVKGIPRPVESSVEDLWNPAEDFSQSDVKPIAGPTREWDVLVVNERKVVNAFVSPGTIVVFTGLLPVCKDEAGLAAVLSHEIGHVVARHTAERLSSLILIIPAWLLLEEIGLNISIVVGSLFQKYLFELPNSRTQELEADIIGLRLMSKACYNPQAAPDVFSRLAKLEASMGSRSPEFFNTHPSTESRIKYLEENLHEGYSILAANPDCARLQDEMQLFKDVSGMKNPPGVVNVLPAEEEVWT